jgi:DNA-binding transcriptional LysR family regulator
MTQAAHAILPYLEELLAQYEALTAALAEWKGLRRGVVRVGANPAVGSYLVPKLLLKFRRMWENVTPVLEVGSTPDVLHGITSRSLDVALMHWDERPDDRLQTRVRWEYDIVVVTGMREVPAHARLAELSGFPFVQLPEGNTLGDSIQRYCARSGLRPIETMVVNNSHTMISMVRAGLGVALLPVWAVAEDVATKRLRIVRQEEEPLLGRISLVTASGGYIPPAVQAFVDLACDQNWKHLRRRA